jgi:hypothetical protein
VDSYGLGMVIYEALTCKVPFAGRSMPEVMMMVTRDKKRPELGPGWGRGIGGNGEDNAVVSSPSSGGVPPRRLAFSKEKGGEQGFTSRPSLLALKKLMEECWMQEPAARPSFKEITASMADILAMHIEEEGGREEARPFSSSSRAKRAAFGTN